MKKICLLTIDLSLIGGITKITLDLAKDFKNNGYDVTVCGIINGSKLPFYDTNGIDIINLFEDNRRMKNYIVKGAKQFKQILNKKQIDIVLLQGEAAAILGAVTRFCYSKPRYIYCDHGALNYDIKGISKIITNFELMVCAHFNDESVFETKASANKFKKVFKPKKVSYIYNYYNNDIVKKNSKFNRKILTVGRLTSQKGYDLLIDVATKIKSDFDWKWYIIGDGEQRMFLETKIREYSLENKIILLGNISNIKNEYANYDIMVCTSRHEGLPLALIDGKAASLPIISFDIQTGPNEIIEDSVTGYLIKPFDTDDMAEKISLLLNDDVKYNIYHLNTQNYLLKFSKSEVLKEWENLFGD